MINQVSKKRVYWLDWVKVIGLWLMVFGHIPSEDGYERIVYTFHMPLFFMISGMLCKKNKDLSRGSFLITLKQLSEHLLTPYFFIGCLVLAYDIIIGEVGINKYIGFIAIGMPAGHAKPIWFFFCMFLVRIMNFFFSKNDKTHLAASLVCIIICSIVWHGNMVCKGVLFWPIMAYPYFYIGSRIRRMWLDETFKSYHKYFLPLIAIPFIAYYVNGDVDMYMMQMGNSVLLYYVFGVLGTMRVFAFCRLFLDKESNVVFVLTSASILILAIHKAIIPICYICDNVLFRLLYALIIVVLFYYPANIIKKYLPFIIGYNKLK